MKTDVESIMPEFASDTEFLVPMKPSPRRKEPPDEPVSELSLFAALAEPLASRGVPDSPLHE